MQPNVYYQVTQVAPAPTSSGKQATPTSFYILIIAVLWLIILGLVISIIVDKYFTQKTPEEIGNDLGATNLSVSLSNVEIPAGSDPDIFKNVLSGRIFTVNGSFDEYIKFKDTNNYTYSYYRIPDKDADQVEPSIDNGTYTVSGDTITLSSGDSFKISHDYLLKESDSLSSNKQTVYFDSGQLSVMLSQTSSALSDTVNMWRTRNDLALVDKTHIDNYSCRVDKNHATNADNYVCEIHYSIFINEVDLQKDISTAGGQPFESFCYTSVRYQYFTQDFGYCERNVIHNQANFIIRIDKGAYKITGTYRNVAKNI